MLANIRFNQIFVLLGWRREANGNWNEFDFFHFYNYLKKTGKNKDWEFSLFNIIGGLVAGSIVGLVTYLIFFIFHKYSNDISRGNYKILKSRFD